MPLHCSGEPRIVGLLPSNVQGGDELLPNRTDRALIPMQPEEPLDRGQLSVGFCRCHPQAILFNGPRGHRPELVQHLRHDYHVMPGAPQYVNRIHGRLMVNMPRFHRAQKHIRIEQNARQS